MKQFNYLNEIIATLPRIAKSTGIPLLRLYLSFIRLFITHHTPLVDYQSLYLYKLSPSGLADYWIGRRANRLRNRLNGNASPEERAIFDHKDRFNRFFRDIVRREWLYLSDCTAEEFRSFLSRNDKFLFKPDAGSQGIGIQLYYTAELDTDAFILEHTGTPALLEALIQQHPDMAALNPTSVNTIRIITARKDNRVLFMGAGLRCGGTGAHVDNFSSGGIAYPIDLETGIVCAPGQNTQQDEPCLWNPEKTRFMPGFQIPHWDILTAKVTQAALLPEHIGLVGWDVAITPDGVEFVEGNIRPGMTIIQLGGHGSAKRVLNFLKN